MKTYVFVGAGNRALFGFAKPIQEFFSENAKLLAVYDLNHGRAEYMSKQCNGLTVYDDFGTMIQTEKPDVVIVATIDCFHSIYAIKAMHMGCDVLLEKPMGITAKECFDIMRTEKETGKQVIVAHNLRFSPFTKQIKRLMMDKCIGDVYSIELSCSLTKSKELGAHGASYFRRWNSEMDKSGGLLIHKASHHFDLVNWWLESEAKEVSAVGTLRAYGHENHPNHGSNCRNCEQRDLCEFFCELSVDEKRMYEENQSYDGYSKDRCVFSDEIDIYDTMAVHVKYDNDAILSYTLIANAAYECLKLVINGSCGRLEAYWPENGPDVNKKAKDFIKIYDMNGNLSKIELIRSISPHQGGDMEMFNMLLNHDKQDTLNCVASSAEGKNAVIIGDAANISILTKQVVLIKDIISENVNIVL